jgi:hypothetical protein
MSPAGAQCSSLVNIASGKLEPAMKYGFAALPVWVAILSSAIDPSPSMAQSSTAKPTPRDIMTICSSLKVTSLRVFGKVFTLSGYAYEVTGDKELRITRSDGQLIAKVQNFSYRDYDSETCPTKLGDALKSCRDPSHGVESYRSEYDVTQFSEKLRRNSPINTPLKWCNEVVDSLRTRYPQGQFTNESMQQFSNNACPPLYCQQFRYVCTVHIKTDPIYVDQNSDACP